MVYKVNDKDDFDKQLSEAGGKLVIVDFYATWCGPCKMIAPKLEAMSQEMDDVVFLKVDVDECEDVAMEHQVSCMPTFVFFKEGKKVESFSGANEEKIRDAIERLR
ncbi:thioredoxin-2 [Procambarus clarkii]|uniref:thioredoxin-2 n=1 Tax=Procambarus clarkii TaxID=6728 RepID=UPI001E6718F0|nr:thioredoxin-2-like [Procambarus clarkii]